MRPYMIVTGPPFENPRTRVLAKPNQVFRMLNEAARVAMVPIVLFGFSMSPLISSPGLAIKINPFGMMMKDYLHPLGSDLL